MRCNNTCLNMFSRLPAVALKSISIISIALLFLLPIRSFALNPGDISIVGMNTDGAGEFAFVALVDIPAGETVYFTDRGWHTFGGWYTSFDEQVVSWTAPFSGITKGTIVLYSGFSTFSTIGDQLIAYQGPESSPSFLAAINNNGSASWNTGAWDSHSSALPTGLTNGVNAVALYEYDNVVYNCYQVNGSKSQLLSAINSPSHWTGSNTSTQYLYCCPFNVTGGGPCEVNFSVSSGTVTEGMTTYNITVISDCIGSHTVDVAVTGGDAINGSDYIWSDQTATFTGSTTFTTTVTIIDDADCEEVEEAHFCLLNPSSGTVVGPLWQHTMTLIDNDEEPFLTFQGFEGSVADNWNYTVYPSTYNSESSGDPQVVSGYENVWGVIKEFFPLIDPSTGDYFWGMQALDNSVGGGLFFHDMDFDPIDVSSVLDPELFFKYNTHGLGWGDEVQYSVMFDNGGSWSSYVNLSKNTCGWVGWVIVPVPVGANWVRYRFRVLSYNAAPIAGLDDVCIYGSSCGSPTTVATGIVTSSICLNTTGATPISIPFSSTGYFDPGNAFVAEISDATGSFIGGSIIGTLSLSGNDPSGVVNANLPPGLPLGTGYRVRINATSPTLLGTDNGTDISIGGLTLSAVPATFPGGWNVSCDDATDGSINLTAGGGASPYSFAWSGPSGFTSTAEDISGLGTGSYTVTVTDANGCLGTTSVLLNGPAFSITTEPTAISCFGTVNGAIDATITGGTAPFSFIWNGPAGFTSTDEDILGLGQGTYSVTVVDNNGCEISSSTVITEPGPISVTATSPLQGCGVNVSCNGGSNGTINLDIAGGIGPFSYTWSGPGGFTSSVEDLSGVSAGTYTVLVTDASGCTQMETISLTAPPALIVTLTSSLTACGYNLSCAGGADGTATATVTGGCPPYSLSWTSGESGMVASSLTEGANMVTVTDANGCVVAGSILLTAPPALSMTSIASDPVCFGTADGAISVSVGGGCPPYAYSWTGPGGYTSTDPDISSIPSGTYTLEITDSEGCTLIESIDLTDPVITVTSMLTHISCLGAADGTIDISVVGGSSPYTFSWSGPGTFSATTEDLTDLDKGTYVVAISDANGCSFSEAITITEPGELKATPFYTEYACGYHVSCNGASDADIDLQVFGGTPPYTYVWAGPSGFSSFMEDQFNVSAGEYDVTITDANGCITYSAPDVTEAPPLEVSFALPDTTDCGFHLACANSDNGVVSAIVEGGCTPYTYSWGNGETDSTVMSLSAGDMYITVTDAGGCTTKGGVILTAPDPILITFTTSSATCEGTSDGTIDADITGGCGAYTLAWTGPDGYASTLEDLSGLVGGTYTLTVTDEEGCEVVEEVILGSEAISATIDCCWDTEICQGDTAQVPVHFTGIGPWTFSIENGGSTETISTSANPYLLVLSPSSTATVELLGVMSDATGCVGTVCGQATIGVNDCSVACPDVFSAGLVSVIDSGDCRVVTLEIRLDTTFQGVSVDISVPCGNITSYWNDAGFGMYEGINSLTGISGLNINGYLDTCDNHSCAVTFQVTYTVCDDGTNCFGDFCLPMLAYNSPYGCTLYEHAQPSLPSVELNMRQGESLGTYPNPFSEFASIRFRVVKDEQVTIDVFDLAGKSIGRCYDGVAKGGEVCEVEFRPNEIPSGIYLCRLITESGVVVTRKMVYVE